MRSVIGQDPSSIQVWWKDVQYFLCNADELTNHPTNKRTSGTTSLAEVKKNKKKRFTCCSRSHTVQRGDQCDNKRHTRCVERFSGIYKCLTDVTDVMHCVAGEVTQYNPSQLRNVRNSQHSGSAESFRFIRSGTYIWVSVTARSQRDISTKNNKCKLHGSCRRGEIIWTHLATTVKFHGRPSGSSWYFSLEGNGDNWWQFIMAT